MTLPEEAMFHKFSREFQQQVAGSPLASLATLPLDSISATYPFLWMGVLVLLIGLVWKNIQW